MPVAAGAEEFQLLGVDARLNERVSIKACLLGPLPYLYEKYVKTFLYWQLFASVLSILYFFS
jgi:hypothetical protein